MGVDDLYGSQIRYPESDELYVAFLVAVGTLVLYYLFLGRRHVTQRRNLVSELQGAEKKVFELEERLAEIEAMEASAPDTQSEGGEVRVWMDGAFDMMHYGHMNAFRQGRALGTYLVVGVNTDASILECKGTAPVMNDAERLEAVAACKWVDEVVPECPYVMNAEYLEWAIKKFKIDYVVHGDDPCIVDGKDVYEEAKRRGFYRSIPRTEGVSTTEIVGRMLHLSRDHHHKERSGERSVALASKAFKKKRTKPFNRRSQFLTTSRMLRIFSGGSRDPPPGAKVVYIDGAWDMFHVGHVKILRAAKALGDYLIVGIHNDDLINKKRGSNYPLMNLNERVLSVLGCRHVDDVLIDAPWEVSRTVMKSLNISVVASGTVSDMDAVDVAHRVPRERGMYEQLTSESPVTVSEIVSRIMRNEGVFQQKVKKKMKAEEAYYKNRYASETEGEPETETEAETTDVEAT